MNRSDELELLFDLVSHVTVLDHKPGELQLKFSLSILSGPDPSGVKRLIRAMPGIVDTRINLLARTLTIDYDPNLIGYELWDSVFEVKQNPEKKAEVVKQLTEVLYRA